MYKILIADDEKLVRKGIISKLQSRGFIFSWVGEAADGEEAMEAIKNKQPDIVITDIKMPYIDGITLIKNTKSIFPEIRFVIISGYAEFEYAEKALNMGVAGYILKPVSEESLADAVNKVINNLESETEQKVKNDKKDAIEKYNRFLIFEKTVNQIFHSLEEPIQENLEMFAGFTGKDKFALALIHLENTNNLNSYINNRDLEPAKSTIRKILSEIDFKDNIIVMDNHKDATQLMVLVTAKQESALKILCDRFVADLYSKIKDNVEFQITIAVSDIGENITSELFKQASVAFGMRFAYGRDHIYKYDNYMMRQGIDYPKNKLRLLENCFESCDFRNISVILKDLFSYENIKASPSVYIRLIYFEIVNMLIKFSSKHGIAFSQSIDIDMLTGKVIDFFDSVDDIIRYLYTSIIDLTKTNWAIAFDRKVTIDKVQEYISRNYTDELMVKDLARKFAINPNYLSTIFKQETGYTISKFIEDIRIERACQMLHNTRNSIYTIAQCVGYNDTQYFFRVFKKVTGFTPMEYRNQS